MSVVVLSIVGARPQFVKLGPVCSEFRKRPDARSVRHIVVHTGQHYDAEMSDLLFDQLGLPEPDENLGVGSGSHAEQTARMMVGIEAAARRYQPDIALVYGDTNSTLAGALAMRKLNIATAHVEAGLRSRRRDMPEEINRIVADCVCDVLMAPTEAALENLRREGLGDRAILTGDVMLDAIIEYSKLLPEAQAVLEGVDVSGPYAVATVHRADNTEPDRLERIVRALCAVATSGMRIVLPLHPRTRANLTGSQLRRLERAKLDVVTPLGYLEMLALLKSAQVVLTDSGGLQKEAFILGTPCVILRDETEWTEAVDSGGNVLAGVDERAILRAVSQLTARAGTEDLARRLYGNGQAAARIVDAVYANSGRSPAAAIVDGTVAQHA